MDTDAARWFHPAVQAPAIPPRALINVLVGAALLRGVGLGVHSLWLDEGATWSWATRPTWGGTVFAEANHPPAWWIVTRLWITAFGDSEAALRAPAAVLGVLTVYLSWALARRLLDGAAHPARGGFHPAEDDGRGGRMALWFAGAVALSTYFTEYAQEARMYSALIAQTLGLSLLYLRWLDRPGKGVLVAYALLGALSLYTHYFALWVLLSHGAHALWISRVGRRAGQPLSVRPMLAAIAVAGLLFVPWFLYLVLNPQRIATGEPYSPFARLAYVLWRIGAGPGVVVVDRPRLEEGPTAVFAEEWPIVLATSLLWFPALVSGVLALRTRPGAGRFLLASLLVPLAGLLLVFPAFQLIHERYLVFLAPWLWLLATLGAMACGRFWRPVLMGSLALLLLVGLVAYHGVGPRLVPIGQLRQLGDRLIPQRFGPDPQDWAWSLHHGHPYGKEPWRQAQAFVRELSRATPTADSPPDLVMLHPWYLRYIWPYYDRGRLEVIELPEEALTAAEFEARYGETLARRERVFVVLAHEETEDKDHYFRLAQAVAWKAWYEAGAVRVEAVGPALFDRSWGVRVGVISRR